MKAPQLFFCAGSLVLLAVGCVEPGYDNRTRVERSYYSPNDPQARYYTQTPEYQTRREWLAPTTEQRDYHSERQYESRELRAESPAIVVQPASRDDTQRDLTVADCIREEIQREPHRSSSLQYVTISVHEGRVTVKGSVRSEAEAQGLISDMRRVPGVVNVKSKLKVSSPRY